jgi:hypothetical protein
VIKRFGSSDLKLGFLIFVGLSNPKAKKKKMNGGDDAATSGPPPSLEWRFSQVFGERTAGEEVQEGNYCLRVL